MQKTENYQLNLWEPEDAVLHTGFNENTEIIDAALAALKASTEESAAIIESSMPRIATGTYTGKGKYGSANANSLSFDFTPKFVMIWGQSYNYWAVGINGQSMASYGVDEVCALTTTWDTNKVSWYYSSGYSTQMNRSDETYSYIAIG